MMKDVFFSIIIPCFNVQDYLAECVESVLSQDYHNFEVILVDDGSSDETPSLCDQLGFLDERIHVFHKQNGGLSDARNFGIDRAKGEYFVFVDGDDFIKEETLSNFNDCLQKTHPDVLLTHLTEYYGCNDMVEQDEEMESYFGDDVSLEKALTWEMKKSRQSWPAQKKIVSKNFIEKNNLRFLKGYLHEDMDWSARIMMCADTFAISPEPWYYHRMQREGSITNTVSSKRLTDVIKMASNLIYGEKMRSLSEKRRNLITDRIMCSVYPILSYFGKLSSVGKKEVVKCCKDNRELFRITPNRKYRIFSLTTRILGFKVSLNLLGLIGDKV